MIKVALVGIWHVHFDGYARSVANSPDCEICALWAPEIDPGKAKAELYGCKYYSDYDEMLAKSDCDAVMVCTSTDMHKEIIIKAANAGKHIFTEKVLCFNEADALEVKKAVDDSGVKFCISYPWRSRGDFLFVKKAIDEGLVGQVTYCRMRNAHNGASANWLPDTFYDAKTCGGGAMMDLGAHGMYILNWLMGRPVKATSAFTNVIVNTVEDNAVTVFEYADGAIGVNETAFVSQNNPFSLEVVGTKGTILAGGFMDKLCYNTGNGWVFPSLPSSKPAPIDMWIDAIKGEGEIIYGIDDAVELSYAMEIAYKNIVK